MKYTLYVDAVNGSDTADGKKSAPFKSAERGFAAVRDLLSSKQNADVTLLFKKGAYAATSPLTLSGENFVENYALTLRGEKGAEIRGTYDIPARLFEKVEGKEYYAYTLPRELYRDGKPPRSKAVYFNGDTRDRAASEYTVTDYNEELFVDEDGAEYYSVFVKEDLLSDMLGAPRESDGKPTLLCNPRMELSIVLSWYFSIVRIEGIDYAHSFGSEEEGCHPGYIALRLADPDGEHFHSNPLYVGKIGDGKHRPFLLYGNLAFLHKAGQYYYDEDAGTVYYYPAPTDDMENGVIGLALCDKLLVLENMKNVTVEGLQLGGTTSDITADGGCMTGQGGGIRFGKRQWCNDAAIYGSNLLNFTVRDCTVSDVYYHGIAVENTIENLTIERCDFKNIGASSIAVLTTDVNNPARNVRIENNYSVNSGYVFNNCCGFFIIRIHGLKMLHNTIIDSSYSAISVGLCWHFMWGSIDEPDANVKNAEIAYNYIENPMIRCYDGGAIYINGGTVNIKKYKTLYNSMHHNFAYCGTPHKGRPKCMETSTSLYHDNGASHWHTHDNVVWADEETLTIWSYISLQAGLENGCARVLAENNYIVNIKDPDLTCGKGRVDARRYIREKNSVMLYKGNCPDGFAEMPDGMAGEVNGIVLGAGAVGRKNARALKLDGYKFCRVGETVPFRMTGFSDETSDTVFQQFDYNERWFHFPYAEVRRLAEKRPEDYSEYEVKMFREGFANKAKINFSSIDTTIGLSEFGLYPDGGKLERTIRFAQAVGCQSIRIYGGLVPEGDDPEVYYNEAIKRIRDYVKRVEEAGIELWLSIKRGTVAGTAAQAKRMLEEIGSESLRVVFSPAEIARSGGDVMEAFHTVLPYIACFDVTDLDEKGMSVPVGGGVLPYEQMLKELLNGDYTGFICLEPAFGRLGGRKAFPIGNKSYNLVGPNSYRTNAGYLALKDLMEKIGHPIA